MDSLQVKRRSANFTSNDKAVLINIVAKYKTVIENKKTDAVTSNEKQEAWKKITQEYNSSGPSCPRAAECLKRCYENKKKLLRKSVAAERREIYKTGGGLPDNPEKKEPIDDLLLSIVCKKSVQGLETPFGGDAIVKINTSKPTTSSQESQDVAPAEDNAIEFIFDSDNEDIFVFEETIDDKKPSQGETEEKKRKASMTMESQSPQKSEQNQSKNWKRYKAQDLKSFTNSALNPESMLATPSNTSRRRPRTFVKPLAASNLSEKYDKLVSERLEIAGYQKQVLQNQIKAEMKEHELRVELLTLQIQREKQLK